VPADGEQRNGRSDTGRISLKSSIRHSLSRNMPLHVSHRKGWRDIFSRSHCPIRIAINTALRWADAYVRRLLFVSIRSSALAEIGECIRPINLDFFIRSVFHVTRQDRLDIDVVITPAIANDLRGRAGSSCRVDV
jgi:hypothetical protein